MLAYVWWHRPASDADLDGYEQALGHFHRSLAHRPPSGFHGSTALRASELPWLDPAPGAPPGQVGYEDWYLIESWSALGVLEEAAVSRPHVSSHDRVATRTGTGQAAVYRLDDGLPRLADTGTSVWVSRPAGGQAAGLGDLLADGADASTVSLWRRCLALGPAPEYCLLSAEPPPGVAASRLPAGWSARSFERAVVWAG